MREESGTPAQRSRGSGSLNFLYNIPAGTWGIRYSGGLSRLQGTTLHGEQAQIHLQVVVQSQQVGQADAANSHVHPELLKSGNFGTLVPMAF